ncbi:type II toxin-antitoxin system VapC family toxin [Xanthobacteraceae bacterium Astr-EGSB]|uniref:type II toxin-antitoxin system VapC family toxin n=1 Tax=Astrobacterium formosum TaxID=3069710 RepID=UPI0027B24B97|nr:type II toxin-antitoxin system VapC family toxin [Xanthobacteraceae bacterium Astr-EGSB]
MSLYLDASVLVALFMRDIFTERSDSFMRRQAPDMLISDFAAVEFASAVGLRPRRDLTADEARLAFSSFDEWSARVPRCAGTQSSDVADAQAFLRRLDLPLRAPDAINIAIARRENASLMTFDAKMAVSAQALGVDVVSA